jgi:hypothetical protein
MTEYELTEHQREKAQQFLSGIKSRDITTPQDMVSSWGAKLSWEEINDRCSFDIYEDGLAESGVRKRVPTEDIVGVLGPGNGRRLVKDRMERQLNRLLDGEFDPENEDCPVYVEFNSSFYVTADGIHRSLSCKALEVEYLLGEVDVVR